MSNVPLRHLKAPRVITDSLLPAEPRSTQGAPALSESPGWIYGNHPRRTSETPPCRPAPAAAGCCLRFVGRARSGVWRPQWKERSLLLSMRAGIGEGPGRRPLLLHGLLPTVLNSPASRCDHPAEPRWGQSGANQSLRAKSLLGRESTGKSCESPLIEPYPLCQFTPRDRADAPLPGP